MGKNKQRAILAYPKDGDDIEQAFARYVGIMRTTSRFHSGLRDWDVCCIEVSKKTKSDLVAAMDSKSGCAFLAYYGHGLENGWFIDNLREPVIKKENVALFRGKIVFGVTCHSANLLQHAMAKGLPLGCVGFLSEIEIVFHTRKQGRTIVDSSFARPFNSVIIPLLNKKDMWHGVKAFIDSAENETRFWYKEYFYATRTGAWGHAVSSMLCVLAHMKNSSIITVCE